MDKLNKYLLDSFDAHKDHLFLKIKREYFYSSYSYSKAKELTLKTISFFRESNLKKGDRVLVWATNMPEWAVVFFAAVLEGIVLVPASVTSSRELIEKYVEQVKPKMVIRSKFMPEVDHEIPNLLIENLFDQIRGLDEAEVNNTHKPDDLLEIMFTSGTTGDPKGVMLSRNNFAAQVENLHKSISIDLHSSLLSILPYSHIYEQVIGLMFPLKFGITIYYVSRLTPSIMAAALKEYRVTHLLLVPEALKSLTDKIVYKFEHKKLGWLFSGMQKIARPLPKKLQRVLFYPILKQFGGRIQMMTLGGAKIDKRIQTIWSRFGVDVIEGYGLTETSAPVTMNNPETNFIGTSGKPIAGADIKIDAEGEVLVKGDVVFPGYFNKPELNKEVFTEDGYFKTGDIGEFDKNGNLVLKGRQKFRIVLSNGEKVYPEDIEFQVKQVKGVKDVCIFPFTDKGVVHVAAAVITDKSEEELEQIIAKANTKLESMQQISHSVKWHEEVLPRTSTLKLIRKEIEEVGSRMLKKQFLESMQDQQNSKDGEIFEKLRIILSIATNFPASKITLDKKLSLDLKVDSLRRLTILTLIEEEFSVLIPEEEIDAKTKVRDLVNKIETYPKVQTKKKISTGFQFTVPIKLIRNVALNFFLLPLLARIIKLRFAEREKIKNVRQAIFITNHPGPFDLLTIVSAMSNHLKRNVFVVATSELWEGWDRLKFGFIDEIFLGCIPIDKSGQNIKETFEKVGMLFDKGYSLLIVPNGENTFSEEDIKKVRDGVIYLAKASDLPIIPCYVDQKFGKVFDPNSKVSKYLPNMKADRKITTAFGDKFYISRNMSDDKAREKIYQSILDLRDKHNLS